MHIAQGSTRLSGKQYHSGDVVPDKEVTRSLLDMGLVINVPSATVDEITGNFDPTEHTVAETLGYVERHEDKADEVYRAESAAEKPRVTILRHLEEEHPDAVKAAGKRREDPRDAEIVRLKAELAEARGGKPARPARPAKPASATLTPTPGEPARNATSEDLTVGQVDDMRAAAGTDPAGEPNPSAPVPPPFDPSVHSTAEVLVHAEANPGDLLQLGKAERAGKNRRALVEELGRRLSASPPTTERTGAGG